VDHGFFLILEVAIGGDHPNGACDCTTPSGQTASGAPMSVGYVAVQTFSGAGSATLGPSASPPPGPAASRIATTQPVTSRYVARSIAASGPLVGRLAAAQPAAVS
jgi:hypothetical protein